MSRCSFAITTSYEFDGWKVTLGKCGADEYIKASYPLQYGRYDEIEDDSAVYRFNCNGEIIFAKGKGREWPHPQEWLKRSAGNDWIYYSTGGYTGVFEALGEYYLPNLQYPTNSLLGGRPFQLPSVQDLIGNWHDRLLTRRLDIGRRSPPEVCSFVEKAVHNSPQQLMLKAEQLFQINGGRATVLPPDCRHVDYDIIPLTIANGCLYKCRFCKVKSAKTFSELTFAAIDEQLQRLRELYGNNLTNYNAVFLGEHDALACSSHSILYGVQKAYEKLELGLSYMRGASIFLFGSVDSLLQTPEQLFLDLSRLPIQLYINIGLESADQGTLDLLGKPITSLLVKEAFSRIQVVNDRYQNIELSANFLMDESLPENHYPSFLQLVRDSFLRKKPKGSIYLSPLRFGSPSRELVFQFNRLKLQSRLPTYLYIIQRL